MAAVSSVLYAKLRRLPWSPEDTEGLEVILLTNTLKVQLSIKIGIFAASFIPRSNLVLQRQL